MSTPDWNFTGETVAKLRQELAELDQTSRRDFEAFSRFINKELRDYKIDLATDPWVAYHGLAFMSLMVYFAQNNFENNAIDKETAGTVSAMARGIAMVLATYAPSDQDIELTPQGDDLKNKE